MCCHEAMSHYIWNGRQMMCILATVLVGPSQNISRYFKCVLNCIVSCFDSRQEAEIRLFVCLFVCHACFTQDCMMGLSILCEVHWGWCCGCWRRCWSSGGGVGWGVQPAIEWFAFDNHHIAGICNGKLVYLWFLHCRSRVDIFLSPGNSSGTVFWWGTSPFWHP